MKNDIISDFLIRIKNAYLARHKTVEASYVKTLLELGKILQKEGFIEGIKVVTKKDQGKKALLVSLAYRSRKPVLTDVVRISKPGLRIYARQNRIPAVYGGFGIVILSTPKGLMIGSEAKKQHLGGEVICKVW